MPYILFRNNSVGTSVVGFGSFLVGSVFVLTAPFGSLHCRLSSEDGGVCCAEGRGAVGFDVS